MQSGSAGRAVQPLFVATLRLRVFADAQAFGHFPGFGQLLGSLRVENGELLHPPCRGREEGLWCK